MRNPQDEALLVLAGCGFVAAVLMFLIKRRSGSSRAISTSYSTLTFGAIVAIGVLFGFVPFSKHSLGLERVVVPVVIMAFSAIASAVFGLVVHLFSHRRVEDVATLPFEARILVQDVLSASNDQRKSEVSEPLLKNSVDEDQQEAWRRFAIQASLSAD